MLPVIPQHSGHLLLTQILSNEFEEFQFLTLFDDTRMLIKAQQAIFTYNNWNAFGYKSVVYAIECIRDVFLYFFIKLGKTSDVHTKWPEAIIVNCCNNVRII
ncbi:hypothetical protein D3C76_1137110 [compost metagenome]